VKPVSASAEVEQDRCWDDWHDPSIPDGKPDSSFLKKSHHSAHGVETKGTVSTESDGMHAFDQIYRIKEVRLPGARRSSPDIHPTDSAIFGENHSDSCQQLGFCEMAN